MFQSAKQLLFSFMQPSDRRHMKNLKIDDQVHRILKGEAADRAVPMNELASALLYSALIAMHHGVLDQAPGPKRPRILPTPTRRRKI